MNDWIKVAAISAFSTALTMALILVLAANLRP
jgi:hypothetical protein